MYIMTLNSGKRPRSSMSPVIFTNKVGDVRFVVGGVGGSKIPSAVTEVSQFSSSFRVETFAKSYCSAHS